MANTTNFGWETPDDTDLVKDGALAMRTLGNAIDTSLVDLKGGTSGQVLSKNSNTDMDFTWVTTNDADAIQNSIVDAKGDLIAASAADTPARLAVGNNGETLVADSSTATGLSYQANWAAGKNKIINGAFDFWARGTSFGTNPSGSYTADRWTQTSDATPTSWTVSRQTFTPGSAPITPYESSYFYRSQFTTAGTATLADITQKIEDVRTFAGQTVTLSFWAKADIARTSIIYLSQNFGSGGSATVLTSTPSISYTTSWQRFTYTFTLASISGKTIGANSFLGVNIRQVAANGSTLDLWGVQLEAGSVATAFQTATGTLAGELAAAQRYYIRFSASGVYSVFANGFARGTTVSDFFLQFPVRLRTAPTSLGYGGTIAIYDGTNFINVTPTVNSSTESTNGIGINGAGTGFTTNRPYLLLANNSSNAYLDFSAEL